MSGSVSRGRKAAGQDTSAKKAGASGKRKSPEKSAAVAEQSREKQIRAYEEGMKLFHSGDFARAREAFQAALDGPGRDMAYSARVHVAVCERRLSPPEVDLPSPEDHYNYAIALINRRDLKRALQHLNEALKNVRSGDHIHYALAICYGLQGDMDNASLHLRRAIELNPSNRVAARRDPDFEPFAGRAQINEILNPERTRSA